MNKESENRELEEKNYWIERELAYKFVRTIINKAHANNNRRKWSSTEESLKDLEAKINHVQVCDDCQQIMEHAKRAMDYINIIPRVVSWEDGEKAIKSLSKRKKIDEEELSEWMDRVSNEIGKEIQE